MYAAGGKSPWWMSGISSYMTMFSAGTFVVFGGIAYRYGVVSIVLLMTIGISTFIAGYFFAARWKSQGFDSAAEFIAHKYGKFVLQVFTWLGMVTRMIGVAIALYSVSVVVCSLIPLGKENILANAEGMMSVNYMILIVGIVLVMYTFMGGLWAVLLTDFTQFIVLTFSVLIVVPLIISYGGGIETIIAKLPAEHFSLTHNEYTGWFIFGWLLTHVFKIGGEWAFVQRYLCVATPIDAKKSAYLFGALYVLTPVLWMLPPIVYRTIDPTANPEQAYILAANMVLPAGGTGLIVASMLAATASMASGELNVFSGALTTEVYGKIIRPGSSDRTLLRVGKFVTVLLGSIVILLSLAIPYLGGAEKVVILITTLFVGPMVMPALWALYVKPVTKWHAWLTIIGTGIMGLLLQVAFKDSEWVKVNLPVLNLVVGIGTPLLMLQCTTLYLRKKQQALTSVV
nr:hypothetical protein [Buttiauxella warmboldiae]